MTDFHQPSASEDARPVSVSARLGRLQFHRSGKFRVLQLADIQDGPKVSKDTIRLIEASLDAARPDIVIFTGNQIAGYDDAYSATFRKRRWDTSASEPVNERRMARTRAKVRDCIAMFLQPLIERGVPFAVTYGNHDFQCGLDTAELDAIYREFPGCLNPQITVDDDGHIRPCTMPLSGVPDTQILPCEPGMFALPVMDPDRARNALGLVMLNSGDYAREGGYGTPSEQALQFLRDVPAWMGTQSMVFQHMPLPQYYDVLKEAPANAAGAMQGYRTHESEYYVIDESKILPGGYLGEGVSCPDQDSGEFSILRDSGGYCGVVAGHDHRNGFVGLLDDVMLVATPTCGFGSYGPAAAQRATRLFEFDIRHPHNPRTQLLEFGELVGKPSSRKAYTFAMEGRSGAGAPSDEVNLLKKPGLLAGVAAALKKI
ncbi:ser/threonine protein phosphatase [Bifidobacterium goeldii]|uniref:Ser/threonine protein phosphatase n=1 Tax=Bifidobacterium goeldii TaxID=2306975 RepID=A0A430FLH2_9BIFI|nr:metallophosphoesterase [Bifidobacterium goeldii]RSX53558.1 ser/threonine protein phosphatase [Bifidobacterium goeldii]